jgi:MSHA pilin protein MshD
MSGERSQGFTLVEMVITIVIVSVGLAGVLAAFFNTVRSSADPVINKQMLAVAEEMLEEILLKPFAVSGAAPPNAAVNCGVPGAIRAAFDDVSDYQNYQTNGICDIDGVAVPGLATYNVRVVIDPAASLGTLGAGSVKKVTVSVSRNAETISLVGWRTHYAL